MSRSRARHAFTLTTVVVTLATVAQTAIAQATTTTPTAPTAASTTTSTAAFTGGFKPGYTDIGFAVGLGNTGSAAAAVGGRFEHAVKTLPDMANGTLGIEVSLDYYAYSGAFPFGGFSWNVTVLPIGVTANYHFKLDDTKFDPFMGAGLGYEIVSCRFSGPSTIATAGCGQQSAVSFIGRIGGRYFMSPKMALYGDVGAGPTNLNIGLMFKMK
jgi:hypothetical protein